MLLQAPLHEETSSSSSSESDCDEPSPEALARYANIRRNTVNLGDPRQTALPVPPNHTPHPLLPPAPPPSAAAGADAFGGLTSDILQMLQMRHEMALANQSALDDVDVSDSRRSSGHNNDADDDEVNPDVIDQSGSFARHLHPVALPRHGELTSSNAFPTSSSC